MSRGVAKRHGKRNQRQCKNAGCNRNTESRSGLCHEHSDHARGHFTTDPSRRSVKLVGHMAKDATIVTLPREPWNVAI